MATIFTDSENSKLHCFLIAHGIYEDDEETQFGEDYDPSACSHSAKFYMTKKIFVKYLWFILNQFPDDITIEPDDEKEDSVIFIPNAENGDFKTIIENENKGNVRDGWNYKRKYIVI